MHDAGAQGGLRARRTESSDRRVLNTRGRLITAFRDLLDESPQDPPSVSAVVQRAGVTRSTFYTHFRGLDDLAALALADVTEAMTRLARAAIVEGDAKAAVNERLFTEFALYLSAHRHTYAGLLGDDGAFSHAVTEAFVQQALTSLRARRRLRTDPEVSARFMGAGLAAVLSWWLTSEEPLSAEELGRAIIAVAPADFTE